MCLNEWASAADVPVVADNVDRRFEGRWAESCRRQSEARRFLGRQRATGSLDTSASLAEIASLFAETGAPGVAAAKPRPRNRASIEPLTH